MCWLRARLDLFLRMGVLVAVGTGKVAAGKLKRNHRPDPEQPHRLSTAATFYSSALEMCGFLKRGRLQRWFVNMASMA